MSDGALILGILVLVVLPCAWVSQDQWRRGRRWQIGTAFAIIAVASITFFATASGMRGGFMPGIGPFLVGAFLAVGPGVGVALGILAGLIRGPYRTGGPT